jgi:prepilin-type N-terminal cleavage/methylation domain-containing protein
MKIFPNKNGFTMIELITAIVIVSIISVMAGMGLVQLAKGYYLAKTSTASAQQAQIALARLTKEFSKIQSITTTTASPVSITYKRYVNEEGPGKAVEDHSVSWSGQEVKIDNDILINNVKDLNLRYYKTYNDVSPSSIHSALTAIIEITLTIKGYSDTELTFVERVVI